MALNVPVICDSLEDRNRNKLCHLFVRPLFIVLIYVVLLQVLFISSDSIKLHTQTV